MRHYLSLGFFLLAILLAGCGPETPPEPSSEEYRDAVSDFYLSLAAIESDQAIFAVEKMNEVADRYPLEPAAWGNLGVFAMRQGNFELAAERLTKARELAPENADIEFLLGILESRRGNIERSIGHLEEAARLSPKEPRILYALVSELERQDVAGNAARIEELLNTLMELEPENLAVLLEMTRLAAKLENPDLLDEALGRLAENSREWPGEIRTQFDNLREDILGKPIEELTFEMAYLRNNLNELPKFQRDFDRIQLPPNQVGFLLTDFLWLPKAASRNAPPDEGLAFEIQEVAAFDEGHRLVQYFYLSDETVPNRLAIKEGMADLAEGASYPFPSSGDRTVRPQSVETFDYNYDFWNDLAFAGADGFMLYRQNEDSTFSDVTASLELQESITGDSYTGLWSADLDVDGDLDLILARSAGGCRILRNNGDDTFTTIRLFEEVTRPVDFAWADLDADGDADAAFLEEEGTLKIYENERAGEFNRAAVPPGTGENLAAIEVADLDDDSYLDLVALGISGIQRVYFEADRKVWSREDVLRFSSADDAGGFDDLFVDDFDNNGGLDLLLSSADRSRIWLSDQEGEFQPLDRSLPGVVFAAADVTEDNRLDLIGLTETGQPVEYINSGTIPYNGRIIRPRASGTVGDRRINSFGLGGEIEVRSGLLYQKKPIASPAVHFGLAEYEEAEMLRVLWPNGSVQAEFAELGYGSQIFNEQMLKGSCPWVFAHNGEEMEFITDFLWRTALGLRINAQGEASVIHSIDWIKIGGDRMQPKEGFYDIRITAELWETHFFDHVSLKVVDHPEDVEVMVDERFVLPAPEQKLYAVRAPQPIAGALDHRQRDVTALVRDRDGRYVDNFPLTSYQGLAEEHYLEVHLGDRMPDKNSERPVWLLAHGWVYPTDSSINIAISQGSQDAPHGIYLQVPDGKKGWKTVRKDIGFPAGKNKTVMINLSELPGKTIPERVRLSTNMEIYWDQITWASGLPDAKLEVRDLSPQTADLEYRGFSALEQLERFQPTVPDYENIAGTTPKWIDLIGHYTRFGDVRELLEDIDDRYVIMNAGDELLFRFKAPPPQKEGWERDFVLVGDGWVKDGDYNTGYSKTVIPLPYHGMEDYSAAPGRLEDDPVYRRHKRDWAEFHTRYITPEYFRTALKFDGRSGNAR